MASQVLPFGVSSIDANTCSSRSTWPSVSAMCFSNAALSFGECAAWPFRQGGQDLLPQVDILQCIKKQIFQFFISAIGDSRLVVGTKQDWH
jgi:hypothetical protein